MTLIISLGKFNPLHKIFFIIPGFSFFRNPSSWLIIYSFSLACLTAFLANQFSFKKQKGSFKTYSWFKKSLFILFPLLLVPSLIFAFVWHFYPQFPYASLKTLAKLINKDLSLFHINLPDSSSSYNK